jgi:hypothetical protein
MQQLAKQTLNKPRLTKVPLTVTLDNSHPTTSVYARLMSYTENAGLSFPQDVIRLAVAKFLEKEGY